MKYPKQHAAAIRVQELDVPLGSIRTPDALRALFREAVVPLLQPGVVVTIPRGAVDRAVLAEWKMQQNLVGNGLVQGTLHRHDTVHLAPVGSRETGTVIATDAAAAHAIHSCLEDGSFRKSFELAVQLPKPDFAGWTLEKLRDTARVAVLDTLPDTSALPPWLQGVTNTHTVGSMVVSGCKALLLGNELRDAQAAYTVLRGIQHALGNRAVYLNWQEFDGGSIYAQELHSRDVRFGDTRSDSGGLAFIQV